MYMKNKYDSFKVKALLTTISIPQWLSGKGSTSNAKNSGLIPESGRSPREGNDNPHQYSCLQNPTDRGTWWATVHGVAKELHMTLQLSNKVQFSSVAQSCLTLCHLMNHSMPGFPITNSWSLPGLMSIESMMLSNHSILCCPLLLLPSIFPRIRVFSTELFLCIRWPKYWSFSFSISPSNEYSGLISFRMDWLISLQSKGLLRVFSNTAI